MSNSVRFDFIHFMHYTHLPENHKEYRVPLGRLP